MLLIFCQEGYKSFVIVKVSLNIYTIIPQGQYNASFYKKYNINFSEHSVIFYCCVSMDKHWSTYTDMLILRQRRETKTLYQCEEEM